MLFLGKLKHPFNQKVYDFLKTLNFKTRRYYFYKYAFRFHESKNQKLNGLTDTFERLEFLGDAILQMVVSEYIFKMYPFKDEGFLSQLRSKIVCDKNLSQIAQKIGIDKIVEINHFQQNKQTSLADIFEAFVGALFLDKGLKKTRKILLEQILNVVDIHELVNTETDYKSKLLMWSQKKRAKVEFKLLNTIVINNKKNFLVSVVVDGKEYGQSLNTTIKESEQAASRKTIEILKNEGLFL